MLDQQQRQFADLVHSTVETLDPAIPVTFTKVPHLQSCMLEYIQYTIHLYNQRAKLAFLEKV